MVAVTVWVLLELLSWLGLIALGELAGEHYRPLTLDRLSPEIEAEVDRVLAGQLDYLQHEPKLGWTIRPNGRSGLYAANAHGLRADRDCALRPEPGVLRIATFGDSFTHGDDVAVGDTWQVGLQQRLPGSEVLNFGVPAYGPGQAWLRYHEQGRAFGAQVVLIGYMAENLYRAVNVFRPFYSPSYVFPLTKPRFALREAGELELIPNPLPTLEGYQRLKSEPRATLLELGEHDAFFAERYRGSLADLLPSVRLFALVRYRLERRSSAGVLSADGTYDTTSEAFGVTAAVLETFCDEVRQSGSVPVVVIFPDRIRPSGAAGPSVYTPLLARLTARGEIVVDLQLGFDRYGAGVDVAEFSVGPWGHYAPAAHEIVARQLEEVLRREELSTLEGIAARRGR